MLLQAHALPVEKKHFMHHDCLHTFQWAPVTKPAAADFVQVELTL